MSREHRERVWQNKQLRGGKLLVMLALAEHANTDGACWPGTALLMEETRLCDRQLRRVLNELEKSGLIVIEERAIGRGKRAHYKLFPEEKAEEMSDIKAEEMSDLPQESGQNVHVSHEKADISDTKSGHFVHEKADISDTDYSHARSESKLESKTESKGEEENTHARDPLALAWWQAYNGDIPENLETLLRNLATETSIAATIHGIKTSAKKDSRNFRYIAECARNYVPSINGNGYHVDVPGVVALQPPSTPAPPPKLPPPMPTDDPWTIAMAELTPVLPGRSGQWLQGSRLEANGELAGVPLYRIYVATDAANLGWLTQQAEPTIRRKLSSLLGKRIILDFGVMEGATT